MSPDLIQELRDGLELVTKGEWSVDGYNTAAVIFRQHGKTHVTDWMRLARCDEDNANWKADAAHIARCSPDNIRTLLDALTTKDAALAEARAMSNAHREHAQSAVENSASLNRLLSIAEARAEAAEASLAGLAAENERLADCLDCARQDWEANNGEIIDKTDAHWTVEARRLVASRALQDEAGKK